MYLGRELKYPSHTKCAKLYSCITAPKYQRFVCGHNSQECRYDFLGMLVQFKK